jgi:hypothetical protein
MLIRTISRMVDGSKGSRVRVPPHRLKNGLRLAAAGTPLHPASA